MKFDVFLSHNSRDKPIIRRLAKTLKLRGLNVWLDEWELQPGGTWQEALEEIITTCKAACVCVGNAGIGPWEEPEMRALLSRFIEDRKAGSALPIIPTLLPGAPAKVSLPVFLKEFTWVDLRNGLVAAQVDKLLWGITGEKP